MTLIRTTLLSSISYVVRVLTGFVANKVVAVYLGPAGVALLGQFNNFIAIFRIPANSLNGGIVKYVAEYKDSESRRLRIIGTGFCFILLSSFLVSAAVLIFARRLSVYVMKTSGYEGALVIVGLLSVFVSLNNFFLAVLNGLKEIDRYIAVSIFSSFVGLVIGVFCVVRWGLYGALIASSLANTAVFGLTFYFMSRHAWFSARSLPRAIDWASFSNLLKFAAMLAVSGLVTNYSYILVRGCIMGAVSIDAAGYWQGMIRISDSYLTIITSSLSIYYLPRLSEITKDRDLRAEILRSYRILLPSMALLVVTIYFMRDVVIRLLYTPQFLPMRELFFFQLSGDFFKIFSWVLGYLMIARAMTRWFIYSEIFYFASYVPLSFFLIHRYGVVGATYAYLVCYVLFSIFLIWLFRGLLWMGDGAETA